MSTHNICFHGKIRKNTYVDTTLIYSFASVGHLSSCTATQSEQGHLCLQDGRILWNLFVKKEGPDKTA